MLSFFAYNARLQCLIFGVHIDLLQIYLSVLLPCDADWGKIELNKEDGESISGFLAVKQMHSFTPSSSLAALQRPHQKCLEIHSRQNSPFVW